MLFEATYLDLRELLIEQQGVKTCCRRAELDESQLLGHDVDLPLTFRKLRLKLLEIRCIVPGRLCILFDLPPTLLKLRSKLLKLRPKLLKLRCVLLFERVLFALFKSCAVRDDVLSIVCAEISDLDFQELPVGRLQGHRAFRVSLEPGGEFVPPGGVAPLAKLLIGQGLCRPASEEQSNDDREDARAALIFKPPFTEHAHMTFSFDRQRKGNRNTLILTPGEWPYKTPMAAGQQAVIIGYQLLYLKSPYRACAVRRTANVATIFISLGWLACGVSSEGAESQWVHAGPDGKLVYKTTPRGDRIMDFSSAGYMGGGVALPTVPVKRTVKPSGRADDTAAIQDAIDAVAAMPVKGGFRGAVLRAGTYTCEHTIYISADGVVLRGSGTTGPNASTIKMTGGRHCAIVLGKLGGGRGRRFGGSVADNVQQDDKAATSIADAYVPAGTKASRWPT